MFNFTERDYKIAIDEHYFEKRINFLVSSINSYDLYNVLKNQLNSIKEAYDRNCYYEDPHFPGEE